MAEKKKKKKKKKKKPKTPGTRGYLHAKRKDKPKDDPAVSRLSRSRASRRGGRGR